MQTEGKKSRKELIEQYKERKITGGIYVIKNTRTGKIALDSTTDMRASRNRFDFSQKTGNCTYKHIQEEWKTYGPQVFAFEVLEELEHGDKQTDYEFESDIAVLKELWKEKLSGGLG